jgi:hypothetical protein
MSIQVSHILSDERFSVSIAGNHMDWVVTTIRRRLADSAGIQREWLPVVPTPKAM